MKVAKERRKDPRYRTSEGAFVNAASNFGKIVNVSMGGLCFQYINWHEDTQETGELDIYLNGQDMLNSIPFQILPAPSAKQQAEGQFLLKECRVKFDNLSQIQKTKLEHFILQSQAGDA